MPSWQKSSISAYFTAAAAAGHTPSLGYGAGRGFPDIALAGVNYAVIIGGGSGTVCGTSESAPAVAAFFSNVNAARMAIGKGPVGFVNPALYAHGRSFMNDIISVFAKKWSFNSKLIGSMQFYKITNFTMN